MVVHLFPWRLLLKGLIIESRSANESVLQEIAWSDVVRPVLPARLDRLAYKRKRLHRRIESGCTDDYKLSFSVFTHFAFVLSQSTEVGQC